LSHTKKYLPNFPTQKNPGIENFKPKKILQPSPSLEIQSAPSWEIAKALVMIETKNNYWKLSYLIAVWRKALLSE